MSQRRTNNSWNYSYGRRRNYHGTAPPLALDWIGHWLTPTEFAAQLQRSYTWPRWAERTGVLDACGIPHMRDRRGRLWIMLISDLT